MKINLYLASELEYRRGLAHRLIDEKIVDFCLADHLPWTDSPPKHDRIVTVNHDPSGNGEYSDICDLNEFPALSDELIKKMLPYESTAIHMGMRRYNYPTTEYDEEKRKYLQHLRFWNYFLDKYRINLIVTHCIPHSQGKYVVYGLSRVKGIPILIWHNDWVFEERCIWGSALGEIGKTIGENYERLVQNGMDKFELEDDIDKVYKSFNSEPNKDVNKERNRRTKKYYTGVFESGIRNQRRTYMKQFVRSVVRSLVKTGGLSLHSKKRLWFRLNRRHLHAVKYCKRHLCITDREYNRLASEPDYSEKYIVFLLQVYPEASVLPNAGAFSEQYTSIQLLSRIADKCGIVLYVKEHPHIPYRTKDFYDEISSIQNVRIIRYEVPSWDLIRYSVAVATQNGTCIFESLGQKKPVLVMGNGYFWKNRPGLFEIHDEYQGVEVVNKIINGISISDLDVKRYYYAVQLSSIKEEKKSETIKRLASDAYRVNKFCVDDRVDLIRRFINQEILGI